MKKEYRSFADARKFVQKLGLKSAKEWRNYCKSGNKPSDISSSPNYVYKKEWNGWGDFLGTGNISTTEKSASFLPFDEAKQIIRSLELKGEKDWHIYRKSVRPINIPSDPPSVYKKEWISWGDWFGTGRIADKDKEFRSFLKSKKFVQSLRIKSVKKWEVYCKSGNKPNDIPSNPNIVYKKEWTTWGDFLGTDYVAHKNRQYRSYFEAKKFVQSLGLKNIQDWYAYCKSGNKPDDIPAVPWNTYKELEGKKK